MAWTLDRSAKIGAIVGNISTFGLLGIAIFTVPDIYTNLQLQKQNRELATQAEVLTRNLDLKTKDLSEIQKRFGTVQADLESATSTLNVTRQENAKLQEQNLALIKANASRAAEQSEALKLIRETNDRLNGERSRLAALQQEFENANKAKSEVEKLAHRYVIRQFTTKIKNDISLVTESFLTSVLANKEFRSAFKGLTNFKISGFGESLEKWGGSKIGKTAREMASIHFDDVEFDILPQQARERMRRRILDFASKHASIFDERLDSGIDPETRAKAFREKIEEDSQSEPSEFLRQYEADVSRRKALRSKLQDAIDKLERVLLDSLG